MKWFKRTFGKRHWKTVYREKCVMIHRNYITGMNYSEPATLVLQIDSEYKEYNCFMTDARGKDKLKLEANGVGLDYPEVLKYLKEYNINF